MTSRTSGKPVVVDDPFRLIGGHLATDFANTARWSADGTAVAEWLGGYGRLLEWAEAAGAIGTAQGKRLRGQATGQPREAAEVLTRARALRDLSRRILAAMVDSRSARDDGARAIGDFNDVFLASVPHLRIVPGEERASRVTPLRWAWADTSQLESVVWPIVWSTARFLSSPDAARLRICAGRDCGWTYVDRSRNGFRRWCEMETCGTTEKTRRRAERREAARA